MPSLWTHMLPGDEDRHHQMAEEGMRLETEAARLKAVNARLVEALAKAPQYVILAIRECKQHSPGLMKLGERDLNQMQDALKAATEE